MRVTLLTICVVAMTAVGASAKPPLRDVAEIDDGLLAIALADEIRKTCDGIGARMIKAYTTINALENRAAALGYSKDEIEEYVTSKTEKARMRKRGEAYLAERGVTKDDKAGLCRLGKQEIEKGSRIGALLKAR